MGGGGDTGSSSQKSEPNVVPLCDILLVLLIIFMVVTPMLKKGLNVKLPEAVNTQDEPEPGKMITVYIKKDGSVSIDDEVVVDFEKMVTMIEERMESVKQDETTKLLLKADGETVYERVTEIMDRIRRANIEIVGLVTAEKVSSDF